MGTSVPGIRQGTRTKVGKLALFVLIALAYLCCTWANPAVAQTINFDNDVIMPGDVRSMSCTNSSTAYVNKYNRYSYYMPALPADFDQVTPVKIIMININVFQKDDGSGNWQNTPGDLAWLAQIVAWLNNKYTFNTLPSDPLTGVPFIPDSKIRFEVGGIYFYQNTAMSVSTNAGALLNYISSTDPTRLNQLNICLTNGIYPAAGYAATPSPSNFGYDQYVVSFGSYNGGSSVGYYAFSGHLAHELGHCLDLLHTYTDGCCPESCAFGDPDYLDDVFGPWTTTACLHTGGWGCDPLSSANTCTNNLMGATQAAAYLSPKQIAKMHRALSIKSVRRYVKHCAYSPTPRVVTSNETWDFNIKFYSDIIIQPGVTLIINCKVLMPDEAKIIIKPGARLEVDGGTITSGCGLMWAGIEVQGDGTKIQATANQGYLIVKNAALIENAREAVSVMSGGVVQATGSTFKNNRRCASFTSYHRPFGADVNNSYFSDCTFLVDAPLVDPGYIDGYGRRYGTPFFITLWDVSRVNIRGCTFQNSTIFDVDLRGTAIYSIDASYSITSTGTGSTINKTKFINLSKGVHAITLLSSASKFVSIRNSIFDNVQQGVQGNLNFGSMDNNTFNIPGFTGNPSNLKQWGIYLDGAKGFSITHSTFTGININQNYGIIIRGSGSFGGSISFNTFNNLDIANQTELNNQLLKINCNTYTGNNTSWSLNPLSVNGAFPDQGTGCGTTQARAGNIFNDACGTVGRHIHSYLNNPYTYYSWGNPATTAPTCRIGNMYLINCAGTSPDLTSCYEEPPCYFPPCRWQMIQKMQTSRDTIYKYQMASGYIRSFADSSDVDSISLMLTRLNNAEANKLLLIEKIGKKDYVTARRLLSLIPNKNPEDKNFVAFYGVAIDLYSQGKPFNKMDAIQEKAIRDVARSSTTVAINAQLVLENAKGELINRQPEIPIGKK